MEKKEKTARVKLKYYKGDEFVPSKEMLCEIKMDVVKAFIRKRTIASTP